MNTALVTDTGLVVETDQFAGLGNRGVGVVTEASIHFGGDPARHDLENFLAEGDADLIEGFGDHILSGGIRTDHLAGFAQGTINQLLISGNLGCRQDQRGVGGGITRSELPNGFDVAGIGDYHRHGGKLIEQIGHEC